MVIRRAEESDIERLNELLRQVLNIHHNARADIFKSNAKKYTDEELIDIIHDDSRPIFVLDTEEQSVAGYAFCVISETLGSNILKDMKTLYLDDLCVDQQVRSSGIGTALLNYVREYARSEGCYNLTLNVWRGNDSAEAFYKSRGFKPQKTYLEEIL